MSELIAEWTYVLSYLHLFVTWYQCIVVAQWACNVYTFKTFDFSFGERGSNTWPSDLQTDTLPTNLFPQCGNQRLNIIVSYISCVACLTINEVELNSEYFAPHKYRFMVSFLLVRDHEVSC